MKLYRNYVKRFLDFFFGLLMLSVLMPIFLLIALILFIANKGNPFFFQRRPGKDGRIFLLVKFKTMNDKRDSHGNLLPDEKRITSIGNFIRKSSLDEIPQLINVVKGDMSLIGPRPLLVEYLPLYTATQNRRHEVRPGITGWAQVNGRNAISWEKKFELDVWYVDNLSPYLDMKILFLTLRKITKSEGISQQGHATMPFFKGAETK
jgi:undecaprenyl phosphate N,N'-diacetylbacillosamine 1-phosphate transferase